MPTVWSSARVPDHPHQQLSSPGPGGGSTDGFQAVQGARAGYRPGRSVQWCGMEFRHVSPKYLHPRRWNAIGRRCGCPRRRWLVPSAILALGRPWRCTRRRISETRDLFRRRPQISMVDNNGNRAVSAHFRSRQSLDVRFPVWHVTLATCFLPEQLGFAKPGNPRV